MRLIDLIPSAFPVILNQSIQRSPLDPKHKDYWEKYNFKYISLPKVDASLNSDRNDSTRNSVEQSQPQVEPVVQVQIEIHSRNEESIDKSKIEIQSGIKQLATNDSSSLMEKEEKVSVLPPKDEKDSSKRRQYGNVPSMQVLKHLAKNKRKKCLTHPLVVQYLYLKWKDYAHLPYTIKCWLVLLWTILLSIFIGISPVPPQLGQTIGTNMSASNLEQEEISTTANVIRFITIFFTIVNGFLWLGFIQLTRLRLISHFFQEFEFWLYGCAVISTLIYLIPFSGLNSVIHEAGAIAVFTCWVVALVQLEIYGFIGVYVHMLFTITKNVLRVMIMCIYLFCAFAFALHILVGSVPELQFTSVGTSLVSSISSALAIVDLETFVALESSLRFRVLVFIFYILLLIMLPIVVINLLIGLAVGDIAQIQADAKINRQLFILTYLERIDERLLSRSTLIRYHRESYIHYPNHVDGLQFEHIWKKIKYYFLAAVCNGPSIDSEEQLKEEGASPEAREEQEEERIEKLQCQVKQLTYTQAKQTEALARVEVMLQKMMENQGLECDN